MHPHLTMINSIQFIILYMLYNNKYTLLKAGVVIVITTEGSDVSLTQPASKEAGSHSQTSLQP